MGRVLLSFFTLIVVFSAGAAPRTGDALPKTNLIAELQKWAAENEADTVSDLEKDVRREFIYRLKFQTERRYDGSDASLVRILKFMQELEENPANRSLSQMNEFLRELIAAIELSREAAEPLFTFIKVYTRTSSVTVPLTADTYGRTRAYLNGRETRGARELSDDDWVAIGELFDEARADVEEDLEKAPAADDSGPDEEAPAEEAAPSSLSPVPALRPEAT